MLPHLSALSFLLSSQHEWPQRRATVGGAFLQCHQVCSYSPHGGAEARTQRSKDSYTSYSEYCGLSSAVLLLWVVESWQALWGRGFPFRKQARKRKNSAQHTGNVQVLWPTVPGHLFFPGRDRCRRHGSDELHQGINFLDAQSGQFLVGERGGLMTAEGGSQLGCLLSFTT